MSRITPEDARAPGGLVGRDENLTRSQFVRRLGKGLLGYGAAAAGLGSLAFPIRGNGALYADGTTSAQTTTMGLQFQGKALSFRIYSPLYTGNPVGQKNTSATFINSRYAVTAYHGFSGAVGNITGLEVADGPNYITNRGNVVAISEYILHPTQDLVILKFAQPFLASPDKVIGTAVVGDIVYYAGYGTWGTPSLGTTRDGNLRAFDARVNDHVDYGSAPFYQTTLFGTGNLSGLTLNARGANGDSGGPAFNTLGELVGIMIAGTTYIANSGSTTHLRLGEPSVKAWIEANTQLPTPQMQYSKVQNGMLVSWDINAVGWILQESPNLSTWTDVGTTILTPGSYTFQGNDGQQFFRFRRP